VTENLGVYIVDNYPMSFS